MIHLRPLPSSLTGLDAYRNDVEKRYADIFNGTSDAYVVVTSNGHALGNDNCRDGRTPKLFGSRMLAELQAQIFAGDRVMYYSAYLAEKRQKLIDQAVRNVYPFSLQFGPHGRIIRVWGNDDEALANHSWMTMAVRVEFRRLAAP